MSVSTRTPALTFDDFCLPVKDGQKADLINGVIYSGELHSQVVPGFWLRPEWLWPAPRPRKTAVLTEILAREDLP
jgi:hypothetical protein